MTTRFSTVLRLALVAITILGAGALVAPWILVAASMPFPGRSAASAVFSAIVARELWTSCLRMPKKLAAAPSKDWTAVAVGLAYVGVLYACLLEIHLRRRGFPPIGFGVAGASLYTCGLLLRSSALRHLGDHWSIQLDSASGPGASLVRSGPYAWIRHPVYLGAMLETVGVAVFFGAPVAIAAALACFCPAEVLRARFEERVLLENLGDEYDAYRRAVGGFVPRRFS